jgi:hypothetical protein
MWAPSLTRSRICNFQFLPGIASAAFLRPESHGTHEHILLSLFLRLPELQDILLEGAASKAHSGNRPADMVDLAWTEYSVSFCNVTFLTNTSHCSSQLLAFWMVSFVRIVNNTKEEVDSKRFWRSCKNLNYWVSGLCPSSAILNSYKTQRFGN